MKKKNIKFQFPFINWPVFQGTGAGVPLTRSSPVQDRQGGPLAPSVQACSRGVGTVREAREERRLRDAGQALRGEPLGRAAQKQQEAGRAARGSVIPREKDCTDAKGKTTSQPAPPELSPPKLVALFPNQWDCCTSSE